MHQTPARGPRRLQCVFLSASAVFLIAWPDASLFSYTGFSVVPLGSVSFGVCKTTCVSHLTMALGSFNKTFPYFISWKTLEPEAMRTYCQRSIQEATSDIN